MQEILAAMERTDPYVTNPGFPSERFRIGGVFDIINGPGECKVRGCGCSMNHQRGHNKVVGQGLRHLINQYGASGGTGSSSHIKGHANGNLAHMRVGTGTGATIDTTTALTTEVATAPNTLVATLSNPVAGTYRMESLATWNAGTLSAITVTEIAIKGDLNTTLGSNSTPSSNQLLSRLSTTDGEFSSFVVNTAAPLAIRYRMDFVFA